MTADRDVPDEVRQMVERSSFGTPEARAARATVSDEHAAQIVARARELEAADSSDASGPVTRDEVLTEVERVAMGDAVGYVHGSKRVLSRVMAEVLVKVVGRLADQCRADREAREAAERDLRDAQVTICALLPSHERAEAAEAERDDAQETLRGIRAQADPDDPALLEAMVYAVMDGTCDLADRDPGQRAWDDLRSELAPALPVIRETIVGERLAREVAERERDALLAFEPCQGGEEQYERHLAVCVPFYEQRRAALAQPTATRPDSGDDEVGATRSNLDTAAHARSAAWSAFLPRGQAPQTNDTGPDSGDAAAGTGDGGAA